MIFRPTMNGRGAMTGRPAITGRRGGAACLAPA